MVRLALDFDGTLTEPGTPLRLRPGAREAVLAFKAAGHHLILHSARCTLECGPALDDEATRYWETGEVPERVRIQWTLFAEMRAFLKTQGLWSAFDEVWQSPGKPHADVFIDDLSEQPDWKALSSEFGRQEVR